MGSFEEHQQILHELYDYLDNSLDDWKLIKELEYLDTYRSIKGEMDICCVDGLDDLVYLEVKSSYNQSGKGKKQLKRADKYFTDMGFEFYGKIVYYDTDFKNVKRYLEGIHYD